MSHPILIVDDSLTIRMALTKTLTQVGLSPRTCDSLQAARECLKQESFSLLILDVMLPDGDGVDFLQEIRGTPSIQTIPVILLSVATEVHNRIRGMEHGADEYIGKPYDESYLIARVWELLQPAQVREQEDLASRPHSLLLIDDSPTVRATLQYIFEEQGYRIFVADTGHEGLQLLHRHQPDLVITDAELPDIHGPLLIQKIRQDSVSRHIPCLLMTGSERWMDEKGALEAGADSFLRKGEASEIILAKVAALLRRTLPAHQRSSSLFGPKRILAVDDSPTFLLHLSTELRKNGYDVITASQGEEALQILAVQSVDVILLDVVMPGLSGQEICQQIRQNPKWKAIPILMLTAMEERDSMLQIIKMGADDYIFKSSDLEILKARLGAQIRRRQFEDEIHHYREQLLQKEIEAMEIQTARQVAEARTALLEDLELKNKELAQINQELKLAKEVALREVQFKSQFLANMSHELRTPLNAILGFSDLMVQGAVGEVSAQQEEFLTHIINSGKHLLALVDDVLDLSKIEAGKMTLHCTSVLLSDAMQSVHHIIRPMAIQKNLQFTVQLPNASHELWVDVVRFKQILYNLLSNAIKFTRHPGTVTLEIKVHGNDLISIIKDTGIGIAPEDIPRLFREFERLESPHEGEKPPGTGLGLALTQRLVKLHQGTISVESQLHHGSTFTVVMPVVQTPSLFAMSPTTSRKEEHS